MCLAAHWSKDPWAFVLGAFPWGQGDLKDKWPDPWQEGILKDLRDGLITVDEAIQIAVASGHGIGKSALVSWIILWAICTLEDTKGVVTANTENQLKTKTWAEVGKWYRSCLFRDWFKFTATALFSTDPDHEKTWRIDMVPWSEENTEAFAGLHNEGKRVLLVFDEASAIADMIWEVSEGALTDSGTEIIWVAFGNPTRNTGRFRDCFGRFRHRWQTHQIDSRTVKITNKKQIQKWVDDHGEDSDFIRIRVRGVFPNAGSNQFIPLTDVEFALERTPQADRSAARVVSVDVARFGDDSSVIVTRKGRVIEDVKRFHKRDTIWLAGEVARWARACNPQAIFVDGVGIGAGVVDALRSMGFDVWDVQSGAAALLDDLYMNKRMEMWAEMAQWLKTAAFATSIEAAILKDLKQDFIAPEYSYDMKGRMRLEKKEDMKARGLASPDIADAIALSFAEPVASPQLVAAFSAGGYGDDVEEYEDLI